MEAKYKQLSLSERRKIERWHAAKIPATEMARQLGRHRSTVFLELKRNYFSDKSMPKYTGYYGAAAQLQAAERRSRQRKLIQFPTLCQRVIERIKHGWTPEQIAGRLKTEPNAPYIISHETIICKFIYS